MALGKNEIHRRFGPSSLEQVEFASEVSEQFTSLAEWLDEHLPDGPAKLHAMEDLEVAFLRASRAAERHG